MSLDVYVMPLWRFKADDFRTPIEAALGQKPIVIAGEEEERPPPLPWYVRLLARIGILEVGPELGHGLGPRAGKRATNSRNLSAKVLTKSGLAELVR